MTNPTPNTSMQSATQPTTQKQFYGDFWSNGRTHNFLSYLSPSLSNLLPFSSLSPGLFPQQNPSSRLLSLKGYTSSNLLSGLAAAKQNLQIQSAVKNWDSNGFMNETKTEECDEQHRSNIQQIQQMTNAQAGDETSATELQRDNR